MYNGLNVIEQWWKRQQRWKTIATPMSIPTVEQWVHWFSSVSPGKFKNYHIRMNQLPAQALVEEEYYYLNEWDWKNIDISS